MSYFITIEPKAKGILREVIEKVYLHLSRKFFCSVLVWSIEFFSFYILFVCLLQMFNGQITTA